MANLLIKTPNQILTDMLQTLQAGLIDIGVPDPQVGEGTDYYLLFNAIANELAVAERNVILLGDSLMPDTAVDTDLDRVLNNYGMSRRAASTGSGFIKITTSISTLVPTDAELISNFGATYKVTSGGTYANNDEIPIESVSAGSYVNKEVGEVLTWTSTPAFAQPTVTVSQAITGGVDAEDDETARRRLLARLQNPPALGNWQQVADMCEALDPAIQKAFIYPAANGPSTLHIALTAYPTYTSKSRQLSATKITELTSAILGQLPEYVDGYVTTVQDTNTDISFKIIIPYPLGSTNLGTGGGWLDFQPFPIADSTNKYAEVTVTSSTSFDIAVTSATPAPIANLTRISWIDRTDYSVKTSTITSATYSASPSPHYSVTISVPFVGIATGDWVFPAMKNGQPYVDAVIEQYGYMGPGEKTNVSTLLPRAYRKPRPNLEYTSTIDAVMLRALIDSSEEVLFADYWYSTYGTTAPTLPSVINLPPKIYVPRHIGFYPASIV